MVFVFLLHFVMFYFFNQKIKKERMLKKILQEFLENGYFFSENFCKLVGFQTAFRFLNISSKQKLILEQFLIKNKKK